MLPGYHQDASSVLMAFGIPRSAFIHRAPSLYLHMVMFCDDLFHRSGRWQLFGSNSIAGLNVLYLFFKPDHGSLILLKSWFTSYFLNPSGAPLEAILGI